MIFDADSKCAGGEAVPMALMFALQIIPALLGGIGALVAIAASAVGWLLKWPKACVELLIVGSTLFVWLVFLVAVESLFQHGHWMVEEVHIVIGFLSCAYGVRISWRRYPTALGASVLIGILFFACATIAVVYAPWGNKDEEGAYRTGNSDEKCAMSTSSYQIANLSSAISGSRMGKGPLLYSCDAARNPSRCQLSRRAMPFF